MQISTDSTSYIPDYVIRKMVASGFSEMYGDELPEYNRFIAPVKESNLNALPQYPELRAETLVEEKHGAIRVPSPVEMRIVTRIFAQMGMIPVGFYDMTVLGEKSLPMTATAFRPVDDTIEESAFRMFCSMLHIDSIPANLKGEVLNELEKNRKNFPKFTADLLAILDKAEHQGGLEDIDARIFVVHVVNAFRMHKNKVVNFRLYSKLRKVSDPLADIVLEAPVLNHLTPRALNIRDAVERLMEGGIPMQTVVQGPPIREDGVALQLNQIARIAAGEDIYVASDPEVLAAFENDEHSFAMLKDQALRVELQKGESVDSYMCRIQDALQHTKLAIIQHKARFGEIESRGVALTPEGENAYNVYDIEREADPQRKIAKIEAFKKEYPKTHEELHSRGWAYYTYSLTDAGHTARKRGTSQNLSINDLLAVGYIVLVPQTYNDFLPFSAAAIFAANLTTGTEGIGNGQKIATAENERALEAAMGTFITSRHDIHKSDCVKSLQQVCG